MTSYIIRHAYKSGISMFYSEHARRNLGDIPTHLRSERSAIAISKRLTGEDSLWGLTAEVWANYGNADECFIGIAENGYFTYSVH